MDLEKGSVDGKSASEFSDDSADAREPAVAVGRDPREPAVAVGRDPREPAPPARRRRCVAGCRAALATPACLWTLYAVYVTVMIVAFVLAVNGFGVGWAVTAGAMASPLAVGLAAVVLMLVFACVRDALESVCDAFRAGYNHSVS